MYNFGMTQSISLKYFKSLPYFYDDYRELLLFYDALDWVVRNYKMFPVEVPDSPCSDVSNRLFKNFRWIRTLPDEKIVFGNGLQPGITQEIFEEYKAVMQSK